MTAGHLPRSPACEKKRLTDAAAASLLKNTLTSQWIVARPPLAWPSRSVPLSTPATTSPSSSSIMSLTTGTVKEPWTSWSARPSSGSPSLSTRQTLVAAASRLLQIKSTNLINVLVSLVNLSLWRCFQTTSAPGSGIFSDFSNIQTINISGVVRSQDPTTGIVTYNTELSYHYSCAYPLEYLINNTQVEV